MLNMGLARSLEVVLNDGSRIRMENCTVEVENEVEWLDHMQHGGVTHRVAVNERFNLRAEGGALEIEPVRDNPVVQALTLLDGVRVVRFAKENGNG